MIATAAALSLGLVVGARHAFEPDHLAAVSTLVGSSRSSRAAVSLGLYWGLGHTIALVVVGVVLIALDGMLPSRVGNAFELAVAAMLVILGLVSIVSGLRNDAGNVGHHRHGQLEHVHVGASDHVHLGTCAIAWRPLTIGLVHGLAGSGALTALAFAQLPSTMSRIGYMLMFGTGSIVGMGIATGLAGAALSRVAQAPRARRSLAIAAGALSCTLGVLWAVPLVG
jgi:hypothetical protein